MARKWTKFPHADKSYVFDAAGLKKNWSRLHKGDCEPYPKDADVLEAWRHYHAGDFQTAVEAGQFSLKRNRLVAQRELRFSVTAAST